MQPTHVYDEAGNVIEQGVSATEFCSTKWQRANFGSLNSDKSGIRIGEHFMPAQPVPQRDYGFLNTLYPVPRPRRMRLYNAVT
jgi:hypothetical protein